MNGPLSVAWRPRCGTQIRPLRTVSPGEKPEQPIWLPRKTLEQEQDRALGAGDLEEVGQSPVALPLPQPVPQGQG